MKKFSFKKFASSSVGEKILFAVFLVGGAYFTDLSLDEELWRRPTLHILIFICALFFDILLIRLLHKMLKRKVIPVIRRATRKAFSSRSDRISHTVCAFSFSVRAG